MYVKPRSEKVGLPTAKRSTSSDSIEREYLRKASEETRPRPDLTSTSTSAQEVTSEPAKMTSDGLDLAITSSNFAIPEQAAGTVEIVPCPNCGRGFAKDR